MQAVKFLLDPTRLTEEQVSQFSLVKHLMTQRCRAHLFDLNLASSISAGYTPDIDTVIKRGIKEPIVANANRTLLDVERVRQEDKIRANAKQVEWQGKASELYHRELKKDIEIQLTERPLHAIGRALPDLIDTLYHPNVDYKKLVNAIGQSDILTDGVLKFIVKEQRSGKYSKIDVGKQSMQAIIGQLGKSTLDDLLPLLLVQQFTEVDYDVKRSASENRFKRLLSYNVNYAIGILNTLGKDHPTRRLGGLLGVLDVLCGVVVYRLFCERQDDVRVRLMDTWRSQSQHTLHTAIQSVDVNFNVLSIWINCFKEKIQDILIHQINWTHIRPLRRALEEHQENTPLHERSQLGVVMNHSYQFAQFKALADNKLASKSLITQYFYGSYIPNDLSRLLLSSSTMEFV